MVRIRKMLEKRHRVVVSAVGTIVVVSLTLFAVGLVFIVNKECSDNAETLPSTVDMCKHSKEAIRSGLVDLLAKVRGAYSKVSPYGIKTFSSSRPAPSRDYLDPNTIKDVTDSARAFLKQFNSLRINTTALTPRELKAFAKLQHFLEHNFGRPDDDYYTGSWMLGPTLLCTDYLCSIFRYHISGTAAKYRPKSMQDILKVRDALAYYNSTIHQYMENIRFGVRSGMVRSVEACLAGVDSIKSRFLKVAEFNATGILQEWFVRPMLLPNYFSILDKGVQDKWLRKYGKTVDKSIREFLVGYIGTPLDKLLRFLEYENILNCVPSKVSSGLANLPLSHVYFNGSKTNKTANPFLPTGGKLDGKKVYERSLAFYTTTNLTAEEVFELGWRHVNELYPQIIDLVKNVTLARTTTSLVSTYKENHTRMNDSLAREDFKVLLKDRGQYYNVQAFPPNESFAEARKNCLGVANAKKFCPKRWEAMQTWFDEEAKLLSKLDPKTYNMFYFSGSKHTTPNCPIQLIPGFMPSLSVISYLSSGKDCRMPAEMRLPFFNDDYGPRYQGMSINAHEARPGHHTQLQGYSENFEHGCSEDDLTWFDERTKSNFFAFSEGWGLYAEYPLVAEFTDAYENEPMSRYGMLKGQIWRALRLVVDSGLHYRGMRRDEALAVFDKYMWDTSDVITKEITRYQSVPGQASSYKIGQLTFMDLQNYARENLGEKFNMRDFHYEVLRHGSVPLDYIKYQIKKYVACKNNERSADCRYTRTEASDSNDSNDRSYGAFSEYELDLQEMERLERYY